MKKIKLISILTTPTILVTTMAPLTLCQCGNSAAIISSETSKYVNLDVQNDKDDNTICTLSLKSQYSEVYKISSVVVKIGEHTLIEDTDYSVSGLNSNVANTIVKVFKSAKAKYNGQIVIKPIITEIPKVLVGISASCSKTFIVNDKIKSSDISVLGIYSIGNPVKLSWNTDYKIYDGATEILSFDQGYSLSTAGEKTFTIKSVEKPELQAATIKINVLNKTRLSFSVVNGTLSTYYILAEKGVTWGALTNKPTATPAYGYQDVKEWRVGTKTGEIIADETLVDDLSVVCVVFSKMIEAPEAEDPILCNTFTNEYSLKSYIPSGGLKLKEYTGPTTYTFQIDIPSTVEIFYFWLHTGQSSKLFDIKPVNIAAVTFKGEDILSDTEITHWTGAQGDYLTFPRGCTNGTLIVKYRVFESSINTFPAFQLQ